MQQRTLGNSGLEVSTVGLGCNNFGMRIDQKQTDKVVGAALDAGINFFDTADIYGGGCSEEFLGKSIRTHRDEVVIASKFGMQRDNFCAGGASRSYVLRSCEASVRRLGMDYIDLYYLHQPDATTPIEETLSALDTLIQQGKVRYVASSNLAAWEITDAEHISRTRGLERFIGAQMEWSLLERDIEREVVAACTHHRIGLVPYFPLASGLLTGKYQRDQPMPEDSRLAAIPRLAGVANDNNFDRVEKLRRFAEERGHTLLELSLSWLIGQPSVSSVLVGATKPEQVKQNVAAIGWDLTSEDRIEIDRLLE